MTPNRSETATIAGGCFWCLEAVFERLRGVERVVSGYTGGGGPTSYREVCTGRTGHAEAIQVTYDPDQLSYSDVLEMFFAFHDPTTRDRQGPDMGSQYRSAIFFASPEQERVAREVIASLTEQRVFPAPIVTEVTALGTFHAAEDYHQGYYRQNPDQPYCRAMIAPKVAKLRAKFSSRLREEPAGR
ncbi:MAG TPA: peptide-methionine (S)-S-oxide reductase MsrA [Methylomirabilota bacterium]|jgi:peptide-methionine (S)-S-oxide reductase|nr:peptide-methionine (S)-S-oxide reductase MsrA [Methylomirabilota bacterium]